MTKPPLRQRVFVVGPTKTHIREVEAVFRQIKRDLDFAVDIETFQGFDGLAPALNKYINLVVFNFRGRKADEFKASLRNFRRLYSGRMVLINADTSVNPCIWGRFYGMNYLAASATELRPYIERTLMKPPARGKTALVFAGGGILGGWTEIGVYRALYDLGLREFDMYIGLSAGAYVATLAAHGIPPHELLEEGGFGLWDYYNPNVGDALRKSLFFLPNALSNTARYLRSSSRDMLFLLSSMFPSAFLSGKRVADSLARQMADRGKTNSFGELRAHGIELYITAMDLDSTELRVFGADDDLDVPISKAVAASSALPVAYKPVKIDDRYYIDGGIHTTANIDVAIDNGADLIICVNPLVPLVTEEAGHIERLGAIGIAEQSFRTLLHQRLKRDIAYYKATNPRAMVLLIEPDLRDQALFHNPLNANPELIDLALVEGYESARRYMLHDWDFVERSFLFHGRPISRQTIDQIHTQLQDAHFAHETVMQVFAREAEG